MKRLVIVLVFPLISSVVIGQCQLFREKNLFTGLENISTSSDRIGSIGKNGQVNFILSLVFGKDTTIRLTIDIKRFTIRCIDSTSKVLVKVGENALDFKLTEKLYCGTKLQGHAPISLDMFKTMSHGIITAIRIYYTKDFEDFTIDQDNKMFFPSKYVCLSEKFPTYFHIKE